MGAFVSDIEPVRHLVTFLAGLYQWIFLDLGRLNAFSQGMLDRVDEVLLVTTASVPALFEAKRVIGALHEAGFEGDRIRLVVNRYTEKKDRSGIELDRLFGIPVYATLPDASQELHDACVNGAQLGEDSEFRGRIARLARKMASLPEETSKSRTSRMGALAGWLLNNGRHDSTPRITQ